MDNDSRYAAWVYWCALTKEEQDEIIEIRCDMYRHTQNFSNEGNENE